MTLHKGFWVEPDRPFNTAAWVIYHEILTRGFLILPSTESGLVFYYIINCLGAEGCRKGKGWAGEVGGLGEIKHGGRRCYLLGWTLLPLDLQTSVFLQQPRCPDVLWFLLECRCVIYMFIVCAYPPYPPIVNSSCGDVTLSAPIGHCSLL